MQAPAVLQHTLFYDCIAFPRLHMQCVALMDGHRVYLTCMSALPFRGPLKQTR